MTHHIGHPGNRPRRKIIAAKVYAGTYWIHCCWPPPVQSAAVLQLHLRCREPCQFTSESARACHQSPTTSQINVQERLYLSKVNYIY